VAARPNKPRARRCRHVRRPQPAFCAAFTLPTTRPSETLSRERDQAFVGSTNHQHRKRVNHAVPDIERPIAKANGSDAVVGLIDETTKVHPELRIGAARTIRG